MTALLVANDGGHLQQLCALAPRLGFGATVWATNDSAQSRSLLADRETVTFPHVEPRDVVGVLRGAAGALRMLRRIRPDVVVSTGASLALSVLPAAVSLGIPAHYIESATRVSGPSMTGRVLARVPRVSLYTQYPHLARGRWQYRGSVFDDYEAVGPEGDQPPVRKVVVSVGTSRAYGFRRLVDRMADLAGGGWDVFWQTGSTDLEGLHIEGHDSVPTAELLAHIVEADVVVCHAGTGSAVAALGAGKRPVLVPRDPGRGEHVDDHQRQISAELARRGLAWDVDADALTDEVLQAAVGWSVRPSVDPKPFVLG